MDHAPVPDDAAPGDVVPVAQIPDGVPAPSGGAAAGPALDRALDADARALASVVRIRILRLCLDRALTNKEIAERLGLPPANTYHHVRTLARRGFLEAEPERVGARGAREVPYRATGKSWNTSLGPGGNDVLIRTFLEEVALAPGESVNTMRLGLRLTAADRAELERRLVELLIEYRERGPDEGGTPLSIFLAVHEDTGRL